VEKGPHRSSGASRLKKQVQKTPLSIAQKTEGGEAPSPMCPSPLLDRLVHRGPAPKTWLDPIVGVQLRQ